MECVCFSLKFVDEASQRSEGDAQILQIIELYCASGFPKAAGRFHFHTIMFIDFYLLGHEATFSRQM